MPTLNELAAEYAYRIRIHEETPTLSRDIARRIRSLSYTNTGEPLSTEDTDKILREIQQILTTPKTSPEGGMLKEAEDSTHFIAMVQQIRNELKRK